MIPACGYAIFHLNLAYSSVEEAQRARIVESCYRPILRLAAGRGIPVGVEATGYTLECIAAIAPGWIAELRALIRAGLCEFVGAGLAQIIGPLVPARVVEANLRLGNRVYERLLGARPAVAMLNEQAFSAGIVPLYREAGFQAVAAEWENPFAANPDWPTQGWRLPCAAANRGEPMPVLWNSCIINQKLQRLAHGDLTQKEYLDYIRPLAVSGGGTLPLYAGDAEIFNFRPGRYASEAPLPVRDEWLTIFDAFTRLRDEGACEFALPTRVLARQSSRMTLRLETACQPIPVKKQYKYNPTRWAVTGRDDLGLNTACWRLFHALEGDDRVDEAAWRELCLLWASDYRTHITAARWEDVRRRMQARLSALRPAKGQSGHDTSRSAVSAHATRDGRFLDLQAESVRLRLNMRKGLAVDAAWFPEASPHALFGSLPHGHFEDLSLAADFFSGHLVLERAGLQKETDLEIVSPEVVVTAEAVGASCAVAGFPVPLRKTVRLSRLRPEISIRYDFDWTSLQHASLRLGHLTLLPSAFDAGTLAYATHNGGREAEFFPLGGREFNHGQPVSSLVSARQCLGMTRGLFWIGDASVMLEIEVDQTVAAGVPMVLHRKARPDFLFRCWFSLRETDETSQAARPGSFQGMGGFFMTIRARKTGDCGIGPGCGPCVGSGDPPT